ncbi:MAG: 3-oxoacyl-ACP reductase FabG [Candidatus Promineifilaceae bacterium]|nr:3-oxoacyl-ACP reductase FabG [Candidatus Promineifilaceae bacterium]
MRLQDKVALITGGAAGIGRATALRFHEEGARIAICDVNEEGGRQTMDELGGPIVLTRSEARFDRVDISDRQAVQAWVDDVAAAFGRIDILINNAGVLRDGQLVKMKDGQLVGQMTPEQFELVIDVNLKGTFNCTQAVAPIMIRQGGGVVLNATSIVGLDGNFGQTNYVASKAGVVGMTKVWARELGRYNIRVNAVAPGFTLTEMVAAMPEKILEGMKSRTPLRRMGQPRDIANGYLFLASDEAAFISGTVLRIDGGIVVGT